MDCITILAQAVEATNQAAQGAEAAPPEEGFAPINFIWEQIAELNLVEALTFICFGVICLLYGWRIFRILVTLSFALAGLYVGILTSRLLIGGNEVWLGIICMALFALFSIPLMRWAVSILGAVTGGILTSGIWLACELPQQYWWAGGLVGLVAGGMISFIIFKIAVMLFTSFTGAALIVVAVLAILYRYMGPAEQIEQIVFNHNWFLPAALLAPTATGIFFQNKFVKGAENWRI